jgi:hypothetical protein
MDKTAKQAVAELVLAAMQLLMVLGIDEDPANVTVNYDGRARRVDIARIDETGQHIEAWLTGLNANVVEMAHVGERVPLPAQGGTVQ